MQPHRTKLNPKAKLIALELVSELPRWWARHPDGLTIKALMREASLPYHDANQAISWWCDMKVGQMIRRPDRSPAYFVPMDFVIDFLDLTKKQKATLDWLVANADSTGLVQASMRDICRGAPLSKGGIVAHLDALDRKDFLRFVERGGPHRKTTFRVFPNGDATGTSPWPNWQGRDRGVT